ncbi:ABC transporter ATP-binding protein [Acrocarpospora pleiomorpha]|uniref:ABC transporter ATP-binding protein n=1 Tax=Acrocarpospora pleiomorpha TaxID=90975 RepID=A0A5M3Y1B0_9ACTN|nr:ATP-binding cassette domain-containing protein [Acrocarpospora pleiomorpha]GES27115.1 ABC transporter ATP-binding protein [Acrocarpospora pleiomorpha]
MTVIAVRELSRHYRVRISGQRRGLRRLLRPRLSTVPAVQDVSFSVGAGEIVGFVGPNGAGKTTVLKCLSGVLHPTSGAIDVLGFTPHQRQRDFLTRITLVMGQRNQLLWDLPAWDSFLANQAIYSIGAADFRTTTDELTELLSLGSVLHKPVRQLSLGERARCELAAAMLHRPAVLFLDEPTLGLDFDAQDAVRSFVRDYVRRHAATVLLTSHYLDDITSLASRVLIIGSGRIAYDGALGDLVGFEHEERVLTVQLETAEPVVVPGMDSLRQDGTTVVIRASRAEASAVAAHILNHYPVRDIAIAGPPLDDVLRKKITKAARA